MHALFHRLAVGSTVSAVLIAAPALAQVATFDVPAQDVASAVRQFAQQAKIQIVISGRVAEGRHTRAISGAMTVGQALERMLADTGLVVRKTGAGIYVVVTSQDAAAQGAPLTPIRADAGASEMITTVGKGQARSVSTLLRSNLDVLPPGVSVQKALNILPGVSAQSMDALGINEQSMTLQVRGYSTTHLGYTLDGMPLGDGAYNNYNGLSINRALISDNLGHADLATGIAGLGIASTSNLGGAVTYMTSKPRRKMGFTVNQSFGSEDGKRTFARFDTGEHAGFSAYFSGQYGEQNLFVHQRADNGSTVGQFNGKVVYQFHNGSITAYGDVSRTNQADTPYLSQNMLSRLGWDWGGYAPDWQSYLDRAYCSVTKPKAPTKCVPSKAPEKLSDVTYTNGQILRDDNLFYVAGDYNITRTLSAHLQVYHHTDTGAGNNWITGWSTQGTATTADDLPVQIRDTRYTIDRTGVLGNLNWVVGFNHLQAGFWVEDNTSSAARYIWTNVTGPFSLAQYLQGQPDLAQWVQKTTWQTRQFYVQDSAKFFNDALTIDFGFKGSYSRSDAQAERGIARTAPPASSQFASGTLTAKDYFLPQVGLHYQIAPRHEMFASYSENMAMFQGGFKLGPQSVSQAVWDAQGKTLKPETSRSVEGGYRYVSGSLQASVTGYWTKFDNRLLQYNPCPTNQQQNAGCGNSFHNAGSVTSRGAELGVLWQPLKWLSWYNSASFNRTTYDNDLNWCTTTCMLYRTAGRQQVDTPEKMAASMLTARWNGFWASIQGKYTSRRYYTYTNDASFGGYGTVDLGLGYDFNSIGFMRGAKLALNITNLTDKRYASNFDNSVFAPSDKSGTIQVFHASAPRQVFGTFGFSF
ncbi:TonB-dependent receptor [Gluconacetobacter sp. 1b LMG 1731]|uniref:TonB-dependent receptor n=1 Tax=Gluconacetobacter dulcium TaxID=2729096 RepID=A0A7W4IMM3_9PROT|nr:TonB-dependent receptor [Gluconacetobacter dulcium]MBB2165637.1 TonB-dependent receptor [Gluconacetobacter dulcium]MBB2194779.1 TonB-dependent receptor [Gluconacetobacter dulcium]